MSYCLLIPHYNHAREFEQFLPRLLALQMPVIIVDDGSEPEQKVLLRAAVEQLPGAVLVELAANGGKGAALKAGFIAAAERGFSHAIQIDADGQHCTDDVERFIEASRAEPEAVFSGRPVFDESAPKIRRFGHHFANIWVVLETCSFTIKDSLCGFRVYPLRSMIELCQRERVGDGMQFDTEILVRAVWADIEVRFLDTRVHYLPGGASHFKYFRDNYRLVRMHTRLILSMPPRLPKLLRRALRGSKPLNSEVGQNP